MILAINAVALPDEKPTIDDVDPPARLADVLDRINDHAIHRLDELLRWELGRRDGAW